jgi:hypothetical protein
VFLPGEAATPFTITGGVGSLLTLSSVKIECASVEGKGTLGALAKDNKAGTVDILFLGCKGFGVKCTGTEDTTAGSILAKTEVELRGTLNTVEPRAAILIKLKQAVKFVCAGNEVTVEGATACPIEKFATPSLTFTVTCAQASGDPALKAVDTEEGMETPELKVLVAKEKTDGALTGTDTITFTTKQEIMA